MTPFFRFIAINMLGGALLGLVGGFAFIATQMDAGLFLREPLAAVLLLWSFTASFATGALGTALAMLPYD